MVTGFKEIAAKTKSKTKKKKLSKDHLEDWYRDSLAQMDTTK